MLRTTGGWDSGICIDLGWPVSGDTGQRQDRCLEQ